MNRDALGLVLAASLALVSCAEPNDGALDGVGPGQDPGADAGRDAQATADQGGERPIDQGTGTDLRPDATTDVYTEPELAGFLDPCDQDADCLSGYCVPYEEGRLCSRPCNDDCPAGWECRRVASEGGDLVAICFWLPVLCLTCDESEECGEVDDLCLAIGDGTFCGRDCADRECPEGYTCAGVEGEAESVRQCVPSDGWCTACRDADGDDHSGGPDCAESLDCDDGDERIYVGAAELCDGLDNDCDGSTDEDFDLGADPLHCGACERACAFPNARALCQQGDCVRGACEQGWIECGGPAEDGCPVECTPTHEGRERCDGLDNDCDCSTDEGFDLAIDPANCGRCGRACADAGCVQEAEGYVGLSDSICAEGECSEPQRAPCGLYTCIGGGAEGNRCARVCVDDSTCVAAAHCVAGECVADGRPGEPCHEGRECASGHCANGFCCAEGDCCGVDADCPAGYGAEATCDLAAACQGSRVDPRCGEDHICVGAPVDDDSACDVFTEANPCGDFLAIMCSGEADQEAPVCPEACVDDAECDAGAHCDGTCQPDLIAGAPCDEPSDCADGYCSNGFCCADADEDGSADCCAEADDCPGRYTVAPVCADAPTCQGWRRDAECVDSVCETGDAEDDDRGCAGLPADLCGPYPAVVCGSAADQVAPACAEACGGDGGCDPEAFCRQGRCVPDLLDGLACDHAGQCAGGHCRNGFCCAEGDCCSEPADCPAAYRAEPVCDQAASCQGRRRDALCERSMCSLGPWLDDDRGCEAGLLANECGLYPEMRCTGAADQQAPRCPQSCDGDGACDANAHCDGARCLPDEGEAGACDEASDCAPGLACTERGWCCPANEHNVDGRPDNGCECFARPGAADEPDDGFVDSNCDGVDGNIGGALFVAPGGNDRNAGTPERPLARPATAVARAAGRGLDVYVAGGTYDLTQPLEIAEGVSVYGAYSSADWSRDPSNVTVLRAPGSLALVAGNVADRTVFERLSVTAESSGVGSGSSYGLFAVSSDGLVLRHCTLQAGDGSAGSNGSSPAGQAADGGNGAAGGPGCEDSNGFCDSCSRPSGGRGGTSSCGHPGGVGGRPGKGGGDGSAGGASPDGTAGGPGTPDGRGNWNTPSTYWGRSGAHGGAGRSGTAGAPSYGALGYSASHGQSGTAGSHGMGGGGGGGGGGGDDMCNSYGGAGGGGGGGGCGGSAAGGGRSGGGSFAAYLWDSNVTFEACQLRTGNGGRGGDGGTGQPGGARGEGGHGVLSGAGNSYGGGTEQDDGSNGGRGGWGGNGGRGGHGGGGAGGPSIGVLSGGDSAPRLLNNTGFSLGQAGARGESPGNDGVSGRRAQTYAP